MATTLSVYLTTTRFLLHDSNSVTFSDPQLINCVNLGRDQLIGDISSPQTLVIFPLTIGQDAYPYSVLTAALVSQGLGARAIQAIVGVNFIQSANLLTPLEPKPFSQLNEDYRINPTNSLPEAFGTLSIADTLYIEPPPSGGNWSAEARCVWLPVPLVNPTDQENAIPSPLAESLVPILAAKWAQSFNDDEDSADKLEAKYERLLAKMGAAMPPFATIPYSSSY